MEDKYSKKVRPKTAKGLIMAIGQGKPLDQRTRQAKSVRAIKNSIRENFDQTAASLLESDVAISAVVQQMALEQAFSNPAKIISAEGKDSYHLGTWRKYAAVKKSAILALRKFRPIQQSELKDKTLADVIIETSGIDAEDF